MKNISIRSFLGIGLLGIDMADDAVRVVELRRRRGKLSCRHCGSAALAAGVMLEGHVEDPQGLASAVRLACRNSGSACTRVALAMPATALITHAIRLPAGLPEEQLEILVELEAAQYMPFALEDASLDFYQLGPAPPFAGQTQQEIEVLLVAARRASVQRRLDAATAAGLTPIVMDSEALALQAALAQGGWQALPDGGLSYQLAWGLAMHRYAR
ncbi:pilus assembly protein PilM [Janthinobacterium sp. SUN073]|uniref:pilus assembly protein PilM n=1 Tax=Janthinobacterium sp. SUN073 TaxID=3004102 RepID=UPI0025AFF864|nr:pilus assembly protein PilM [Janthinobacterium sp. SUN073]MDN2698868.1 pilus assembly protein PilM [Janthinobacterium sp. SUN073]